AGLSHSDYLVVSVQAGDFNGLVVANASIVDKHVEPAKLADCEGDGAGPALLASDIEVEGASNATGCLDLGNHFRGQLVLHVGDDGGATLGCEADSCGASNPASASGDDANA